MSADVDQLQRKWKELVAGNRMRCSFPAFNWNKDGVQFEAGNPLSSSSGAHFYQARLIKKEKKKTGTWSWRSCSQPSKTNPNFHQVKKQYRINLSEVLHL